MVVQPRPQFASYKTWTEVLEITRESHLPVMCLLKNHFIFRTSDADHRSLIRNADHRDLHRSQIEHGHKTGQAPSRFGNERLQTKPPKPWHADPQTEQSKTAPLFPKALAINDFLFLFLARMVKNRYCDFATCNKRWFSALLRTYDGAGI